MIKKLLLSMSVMLVSALLAEAAPALPGIKKMVRLTDGTMVQVQLRGDEHGSWWADAKGNAYKKQMNGNDDVYEKTDLSALARRANIRRETVNAVRQSKTNGPRRITPGMDHQPYEGSKKGLILLVQYQDLAFEQAHTRDLYNDAANTVGFTHELGYQGSIHDYFYDMSDGKFDLSFDVLGPFTLKNNQAYYGGDTGMMDANAYEMVLEACQTVDQDVDFSDYDWDGDGIVDQVIVIYAGHGQNGIGGDYSVWPHEYYFSQNPIYSNQHTELPIFDNVQLDTYACTSELTVYGLDENDNYIPGLDGIGTLCHEFAHCLGLPDMYDTGEGEFYGMGTWDLMDQGSYNAHAFLPASLTAYELSYIGWRQPIELTEDCTIDDMQAITEGGNTYIIYNEGYRDIEYQSETGATLHREEYYLLENRQPTKWDRGLYGNGLLITHVEYFPDLWAYNAVNWSGISEDPASVHQYCHVVCADDSYVGVYDIQGIYGEPNAYIGGLDISGDTYPYEGNDSLTNTSWPYAKVYRANTDGSMRLNKAITGIHRNDDGTVGFTFRAVDTNTEISEEHFRTGKVFLAETFDKCNGKGGNDGKWGPSANIGSAKLDADNYTEYNQWDGAIMGANQCAKIGVKGKAVPAITPLFYTEGMAYVTFQAAPYHGDNNVLTVWVRNWSFMGGGVVIDNPNVLVTYEDENYMGIEFELQEDQWTDCSFTIFGEGDIDICFCPGQRAFLDSVYVQAPKPLTATSIQSPVVVKNTNGGLIYDLQGRRIDGVPEKGIYIVGGRKVLVK